MSIGLRLLTEQTVFWIPPVSDGLGGDTWAVPKQIMGRWQYSIGSAGPTLRYIDSGTVISNRTSVWVSEAVEVGSYLWKGEVDSLPKEYDAYKLASKVVAIANVRAVYSEKYLFKVYLEES